MGILRTGITTLDIQENNLIYSKELDHLRIFFFLLRCEIGFLKKRGFLRKTLCSTFLFGGPRSRRSSGVPGEARSSVSLHSLSCDKGEL